MGFRMRKSINLGGGFRINLSKSGVGYSWGVPGYRITRTAKGTTRRTYSIPGTGLSYVDESGKNKSRSPVSRNNSRQNPHPAAIPSQPEYVRKIESAEIDDFKSAEIGNITSAIERTIRINKWGTILLVCGILTIVQPLFILAALAGAGFKIAARKFGAVQLEYTLDDEKTDEYNRRTGAWRILSESNKEWQVIQESHVTNRKVNAGAGRNINRVPCKIGEAVPFYVKTNVATVELKLHKEVLIFLPDKVFIIRKNKVGLVNYEDINIRTSQTRFIENESVPKDATVVGTTWQYVNKNGTPDRRFKNNRQLPICQYGAVYLTSNSGLNIEMQFSNEQKVQDFGELIR